MIKRALLVALMVFSSLGGTELMPWFGKDKEFELRARYLFQSYDAVHASPPSTTLDYGSEDHFLHLSLAISPFPSWAGEIEFSIADTRQDAGVHGVKTTVRRLLWDDISGDPLSISIGTSVVIITESSYQDISTPHHAYLELEPHIAVGKEWVCRYSWTERVWGVAGLGMGTEGFPWIWHEAAFEKNVDDTHIFQLTTRGRWSSGNTALDPFTLPFEGYADVAHRHLDVGIGYVYMTDYNGSINVEYSRTVYAHNFPKNGDHVSLTYLFPFGL